MIFFSIGILFLIIGSLFRLTDDIDRLLFKDIWTYELFFDRDAIIGISNYAHFYYDRKKITEI